MTTRILTPGLIALAALLFAATSQAGELSLEMAGLASGNSSESSASSPSADCASTNIVAVDTGAGSGNLPTASSATSGLEVADADPDSVPNGTSSSGSITAPDAIGTPHKARSNRWQSLVPGAIK